jgi:hypothetical protein
LAYAINRERRRFVDGTTRLLSTSTIRNGPESASYARKFSGRYAHRTIEGEVGHTLAQAFAQAVLDVEHI